MKRTRLAAFDARGQRLPARLGLRGRMLLIRVNDAGVRYPLTIDPFVQVATLTTSDSGSYIFGAGIAISGDTTSIACTLNSNPGPAASGTTQLDVTSQSATTLPARSRTNARRRSR